MMPVHIQKIPVDYNTTKKDSISPLTQARMRLMMLSTKHPDKTIFQLAKMVGLTPVEADKFLNCAMNRLNL